MGAMSACSSDRDVADVSARDDLDSGTAAIAVGKARQVPMRGKAAPKLGLAALGMLLLPGCVVLERQQATLEGLSSDVRELAVEISDVEQSVSTVSERMQQFERAVGARLDRIDEATAKPISLPVSVCQMPELPVATLPPQTCEALPEATRSDSEEKMVVGAGERVRVTPAWVLRAARIDTGADSSSLSATNMKFFERDGDDWVSFDLEADGEIHTLEREVLRFVRVIQQSDPVGSRRPVVRLRLQVGDVLGNFSFSLSDRTHLKHAIILGRNVLIDLMTVDVSREYLWPLQSSEG